MDRGWRGACQGEAGRVERPGSPLTGFRRQRVGGVAQIAGGLPKHPAGLISGPTPPIRRQAVKNPPVGILWAILFDESGVDEVVKNGAR